MISLYNRAALVGMVAITENERSVQMATNNPTPPNIDQRLEAITQTLELLAGMQQANEKAIADLTRIVAPIAQLVIAHEQRLKRLEEPGSEPPSHN